MRDLIPRLLFQTESTHHCLGNPIGVSEPSSHDQSTSANVTTHPMPHAKYDLVLHIGMAGRREYFTLETCAHRNGYESPDIDGRDLKDDTLWQDEYNAPEVLRPTFDTADVWRRWKSELTDEDIRPSDDAGHYLCDFTYFTSMLEYWRRDPDGRRPCMFLHVPRGTEEADLARGRRVALGLITALIQSEVARRERKELDGRKPAESVAMAAGG